MKKVNYANHAKSLFFFKEQNKSGKKLRVNLEAKLQLEQENRWLQWVGLLLLLTIFSGVGIWSFSKNWERYKYQNLKSKYQERVARIEVIALRAQMNPHFIFKCLNGIILFIDKNRNAAAIPYLAKFSKLIRKVLENSASETITLDQEIQALRLYLEIEHMRFGEKLVYEIVTDTSLGLQGIHIPSMIIQPFVENAIWHGLMHKEEGGTVKIKLTKKDEKSLVIEIIDNGIGREKAERLTSKSALKHKSFSMKITAERMEILNRLYSTASSIDIIDLKEGGHSAGTHVKIDLPI